MDIKKAMAEQEKQERIRHRIADIITILVILAIGAVLIVPWVIIENKPTVTFDSQWMESYMEENGEEVIYWEIDWVDNDMCRRYEYTTHLKTKIHIYYECEDYSSGFYVIMNPQTGRCTIWEDGH